MTESEWLVSEEPAALLRLITENPDHVNINCNRSPRKLRLFACACCRQVWDRLADPRSRRAVEVAERYADGGATEEELIEAHRMAISAYADLRIDEPDSRRLAARATYHSPECPSRIVEIAADYGIPSATQAALIRCLFGNPWRPAALCGCKGFMGWKHEFGCEGGERLRTTAVLSVARAVYANRAWGDLPVLCDALVEEAGFPETVACPVVPVYVPDNGHTCFCECKGTGRVPNPLLDHLRGGGPHARGCWAVDLILGKG